MFIKSQHSNQLQHGQQLKIICSSATTWPAITSNYLWIHGRKCQREGSVNSYPKKAEHLNCRRNESCRQSFILVFQTISPDENSGFTLQSVSKTLICKSALMVHSCIYETKKFTN